MECVKGHGSGAELYVKWSSEDDVLAPAHLEHLGSLDAVFYLQGGEWYHILVVSIFVLL